MIFRVVNVVALAKHANAARTVKTMNTDERIQAIREDVKREGAVAWWRVAYVLECLVQANQTIAQLQKQKENASESYRLLQNSHARMRDIVDAINEKESIDNYHAWMPDEDNHLETLSCAILIPAEWFRNILEEKDETTSKLRMALLGYRNECMCNIHVYGPCDRCKRAIEALEASKATKTDTHPLAREVHMDLMWRGEE